MSYLHWHAGMKVTLRRPIFTHPDWIYPVFGEVYTIRAMIEMQGSICILLEEIRNKSGEWCDGVYEPGFEAWGFRPVQTRKTDISCFTAMLTSTKQKVRA